MGLMKAFRIEQPKYCCGFFFPQAAFLVPVVAQMMRDGVTASSFKEQQEPECIITAPTRELINQIFLEARKFVYG